MKIYKINYLKISGGAADNEFMNKVKQDGLALEFVPKETDNYIDICKEAVKQNGLALQFIKWETFSYLDEGYIYYFSMDAVKQNGLALQYAPQEIVVYFNSLIEQLNQADEINLELTNKIIEAVTAKIEAEKKKNRSRRSKSKKNKCNKTISRYERSKKRCRRSKSKSRKCIY